MKIAVLMTCHNRANTTCACLRRLVSQLGENDKVFLVDDGSTDGTGAKVRFEFPMVRVIDADGSFYWAKGMRKAWEIAAQDGNWDAYLWLNDDTMLSGDAINKMLSANDGKSLVVGELHDADGKAVYGLNVNGWVNGNCVLVPRAIYKKCGMLCGDYAHAWADSDYAYHVRRVGFPIVGAGNVGAAEWHPIRPDLSKMSFRERLHSLVDPKGWNLHDLWLYRRRNWSVYDAVVSVVHMTCHVLFSRAEK